MAKDMLSFRAIMASQACITQSIIWSLLLSLPLAMLCFPFIVCDVIVTLGQMQYEHCLSVVNCRRL